MQILPVFISALILAFAFTPLVQIFARRIGAIDVPKDSRRIHKEPIPRLGGLAIFGAFLIALLIYIPITREIRGMLIGASVLILLGIVDDTKNLPAKVKLLVQIFAAWIAVSNGIKVEWVSNPLGGMLYAGRFTSFLTIFWIVGITNTLNFIDGLDGLAAGVAAIASITLLVIANSLEYTVIVFITAALAGGILGFLPYNFNPAKIFMGDTGSMFLGYILACVSVIGAIKSAATLAFVIPVLALGLPIFDTAFAILRRYLNGAPIMEADRGHLHHRLLDLGMSQRQAVVILYGVSASLGGTAFTLLNSSLWSFIFFFMILVGIVIYGVRQGVVSIKFDPRPNSNNIKG